MSTTVSLVGALTWSFLVLPQPDAIENLQKEIKTTHLTTFLFDGARAALTKSLSLNPMFQATHSFALGSQTLPPSYNLLVGNLTWINQASLLLHNGRHGHWVFEQHHISSSSISATCQWIMYLSTIINIWHLEFTFFLKTWVLLLGWWT